MIRRLRIAALLGVAALLVGGCSTLGYYYQADDQPNVRLFNGQIGGPFYHYWTLDLGTP